MIKIEVTKTNAKVITRDTLTVGQVNAVPVSFSFSPEWEGLTRIAVFKAGDITKDVKLETSNECFLPPEVTPAKGLAVYCGVYGVRDGVIVIPSVNVWLGIVNDSANPGNDTAAANPDLWEQAVMQMDKVAMVAAEAVSISERAASELDKKADIEDVYTKDQADTLLSSKADAEDVYTKEQADTLLSSKADAEDVYTKDQADTLFSSKADAEDVYTKEQADTLLSSKADIEDVYTKEQADTLLSSKADAEDVYTKEQADTLLSSKADSDDVYTKEEVDALLPDNLDVLSEHWISKRQRFNDKPIMIAYSNGADLGYINTELAYVNAAIAGFRWLKGDVQPTSDGKLVMCHDDRFTFDSDGYITNYNANSENTRVIHDMTYAECMACEYARKYHINTIYVDGVGTRVEYHPKVCDLEQFLIVCKEFEVQPYIVIRTKHMDVVVPELLRLLEAYDFTEHCIVNSFSLNSVKQVAEQSNHRVMISVVKEYAQGATLTNAEIDNLLATSPNCTINIYTKSTTDAWNNAKLAEASKKAIEYAKSLGVVVGTAFVKQPHKLFKNGIGLMQCDTVCIQPKVTTVPLCISLLNGVATVERSGIYSARFTADTRISGKKLLLDNIRLLGSERDFADGVPPALASLLPYSLSVTGDLSSKITNTTLNYGCSIQIEFDTSIASLDTSSKKKVFVKFVYGI